MEHSRHELKGGFQEIRQIDMKDFNFYIFSHGAFIAHQKGFFRIISCYYCFINNYLSYPE
jgi:hypothetical protein